MARYRKVPPYWTSICTRPVLHEPDGPYLGGQRARARPTQVLKLCMCPLRLWDTITMHGFQTAQNRSCSVHGGLFATVII